MGLLDTLFGNDGYADYNTDIAELARLREQNPLTQQEVDTGLYTHPGTGGLMSSLPVEQNIPIAQYPNQDQQYNFQSGGSSGRAQAPQLQGTGLASLMSMATQNYNKEDPFQQLPQGKWMDYLSLMSRV